MSIEDLVGRILIRVDVEDTSRVVFHCLDGAAFAMYHMQNCCESVYLQEVHGDIADLHGMVTEAYEAESADVPSHEEYHESFTWTFYVISTRRGAVTLRWYGTSNGYYSESVDFTRVN